MTVKGKERKQVPQLPDDIVLEIFKHLPAAGKPLLSRPLHVPVAESVSQAWQELSLKNKLWQTLCLKQWRSWPPPPADSSYYLETTHIHPTTNTGETQSNNDVLHDQKQTIEQVTRRMQFPPDHLPSLRTPHQWYGTSSPPYDMSSWKGVYRSRHEKDRIAQLLLDEIIEESRSRILHMEGIVEAGIIEARDFLERIVQPPAYPPRSSISSARTANNGQPATATATDLTRSYYARKILRKLSREWVLQQWRQYRLRELNFPIWQGCVLISMFSNYELEPVQVDRQFQELADEFLMTSSLPGDDVYQPDISTTYHINNNSQQNTDVDGSPSHPSTSINLEQEREIRRWDQQVERFKALLHFFTEVKRFRGNTENYYDPSNSYIDRVLERRIGIPISLCIVFAELARRVGIHGVDLMGFPQHFMLRFQPTRTPTAPSFLSSPRPLAEQLDPPVYYLDLFNPPHQLIAKAELQDYFTGLNISMPSRGYTLPATAIEVFLRVLRNIYFAIEHTGGAGRLTSEDKMKLYSAMTQLLVLQPSEESGFYLLWLKYLSENWPEDVGFVRAAIVEMEALDMRRTQARTRLQLQARAGQQGHTIGYSQTAGLSSKSTSNGSSSSSASQTVIRFMQSRVRELEVYDDMGETGEIRRRRRSKAPQPSIPTITTATTTTASTVASDPPALSTKDALATADPPTPTTPTLPTLVDAAHGSDSLAPPAPQTPQQDANGSPGSHGDGGSPSSGFGARRPEPLYYVGEVFRHRFYRYMGVICGYDLQCEAEESWIVTMGVDSLPLGRNQPFYHALLVDGTRTYVAQENVQVVFRDLRSQNEDRQRLSSLRKASLAAMTASSSPSTSSIVDGEARSRVSGSRASTSATRYDTDLESQWASSPSRHSNVHPEQNSRPAVESGHTQDSPESAIEDEHLRQRPERGGTTLSSSPSSAAAGDRGLGLSFTPNASSSASAHQAGSSEERASGRSTGGEMIAGSTDQVSTPSPRPAANSVTNSGSTSTQAPENMNELRFSELGPMGTEDVGKFFEAWDGENSHYVMNKELRRRYPTEDYLW
ncbi:hypothetical protein DFQ27_008841 [Actinomortierella ambigua]|uniref:Hemimethylated DNA-binding domain-containing protein n=1 Tax=Actinomortierella ambigua TaxID=1343610 RepID=A0A9P6PRR3_9FUNG|nr:hypothetical protein DFQ27_008841 [Actinomortierella ambigua]